MYADFWSFIQTCRPEIYFILVLVFFHEIKTKQKR